MTASQRIRRAALPTIMAAVIGVGGLAMGAATGRAVTEPDTQGELPGG